MGEDRNLFSWIFLSAKSVSDSLSHFVGGGEVKNYSFGCGVVWCDG